MSARVTTYEQAVFAQEQLEKLYESLYKQLWPYRGPVCALQNAIMFRRSHVLYSLVLFVFVHAAFVWYVRAGIGFIGILANILFLYFILDLLLYASTYKDRKAGNKRSSFTERPPARLAHLESIICSIEEPKDASQSFTYEEICCLFAKRWNWLNMLGMALRHWNREDPLIFSCILGLLGLVLIIIGWYVPGVVLSYCIIMTLLLWPYIEYHQLHDKLFGHVAVTMAKLINKAVRWLTQMKEYAEDDVDIGTKVATLDDGFEDLGGNSTPQRLDSFFGPTPIRADVDPLQSIIDPSLANVDLNMSLMSSMRRVQYGDDEDATVNDVSSLSEDFGHYDSHEDTDDDAIPDLNFDQHVRLPHSQQPSNLTTVTMASGPVNTSTPVDHQVLPQQQQEHLLPTYDEVMQMDPSLPTATGGTHYYPDESKVTYRHKNTT